MDINSLPDDPAALKALIVDMAAEHQALEQRLRLLNLIIYGPKSEKKPRTGQEQQLSLFDEAEQAVEEHKPQTFEEACAPASTRRKRGRRPNPADLPRVEIIHDLPESEKACPCGAELVRIGEEVSEKLDIVPAKIQVIRHIRPKYACRTCEGVEADGPTVKTAPMPPQIIPQGIVTPGLLAHVAVAKYADALPLYRQEDQFARLGCGFR
ncbi:IS66 family transposase zinc-finger binding domain-containing protein [Solidesulfovibrio magneticus]|uniref:Transposase orf3 n=1 Tax=Solidesulfovibrio magneticus (strain ATCC 700980 / DSM 13731 / RS-1) TaxID=573370 RepID=C4XQH8_SOLM1|nr:IS66 family transposase zinc-finger binding domain-containing protein [Solidesulfovibrio magneticus]BAH75343.1 putative transposase orf3 [Solidesulfovibrio magneticus RS-1]